MDSQDMMKNRVFYFLLTYSHWNTPRYPTIKSSEINFNKYTKSIGIVKKAELFQKKFREVSNEIEKEFFEKVKWNK
jgi:hypothetical protein